VFIYIVYKVTLRYYPSAILCIEYSSYVFLCSYILYISSTCRICLELVDGHLGCLILVNIAKSSTQNINPATLLKVLYTMNKPKSDFFICQFIRNFCVKRRHFRCSHECRNQVARTRTPYSRSSEFTSQSEVGYSDYCFLWVFSVPPGKCRHRTNYSDWWKTVSIRMYVRIYLYVSSFSFSCYQ
jgi:hypothetical protein